MNLLERGNANRKTGATDWNSRSSRSHAVFTIIIESRPNGRPGKDEVRVSRLTLIDLAGSEKAVSDAERRGEGKHINQRCGWCCACICQSCAEAPASLLFVRSYTSSQRKANAATSPTVIPSSPISWRAYWEETPTSASSAQCQPKRSTAQRPLKHSSLLAVARRSKPKPERTL